MTRSFGGRDRNEGVPMSASSFMAGYGGGHGGHAEMQPSLLGFVAKQEMPPHLSILFRARYRLYLLTTNRIFRPPLEYSEPIEKGKCKPLRGLNDGLRDYMSMFEDQEPPKPKPLEKANEKKERIKREKIVKHLLDQK